jgi:hypothetical protein
MIEDVSAIHAEQQRSVRTLDAIRDSSSKAERHLAKVEAGISKFLYRSEQEYLNLLALVAYREDLPP